MNKETGILLGVAALGAGALLLSRDASAEGTSTGNGGGTSTGNGGGSIGDVIGSDTEVGTAPTPARSPESAPRGYALGGQWTREPEYPFGFADPNQYPLFPQKRAELMGGRIPVTSFTSEMPYSLLQCKIGRKTAKFASSK